MVASTPAVALMERDSRIMMANMNAALPLRTETLDLAQLLESTA
jgi:hypothetical protein